MEAELYHYPTKKATVFTLLLLLPPEREALSRQKAISQAYPIEQLGEVLEELPPSYDCYISMAEFFGHRRRTCNFAQTAAVFVDFDTHKVGLGALAPKAQAEALLAYCNANLIPCPSLIVYSGRGLHAKWILEHYIPNQALPRWQALERELIGRFPPEFGADRQVSDITRVLRIVGTKNSRNGQICRVLWCNGGFNRLKRYGFDALCAAVLPMARPGRPDKKPAPLRAVAPKGSAFTRGNLYSHSIRETCWLRYLDLMALAELRKQAGTLEGSRQLILFWAMNALAQSRTVARPLQFWNECHTMAQRLGNYRYHDMGELYRRVKAHQRGETVEFHGQRVTPTYRARTATLVEALGIEGHEMEQMRVLVDAATIRMRRQARQNAAYKSIAKGSKRIIKEL